MDHRPLTSSATEMLKSTRSVKILKKKNVSKIANSLDWLKPNHSKSNKVLTLRLKAIRSQGDLRHYQVFRIAPCVFF